MENNLYELAASLINVVMVNTAYLAETGSPADQMKNHTNSLTVGIIVILRSE